MDQLKNVNVVILAAGQGTRMKSRLPKVLHPLAGRPLIGHSLRTANGLGDKKPVVVIGHGADAVKKFIGSGAEFAVQEKQLGTAHALLAAEPSLIGRKGLVLVISADMPLLTPETLNELVEIQTKNKGPLSLLTVRADDSHGFGRVLRDHSGRVEAIVEEAHATPEQLKVNEFNAGVYCIRLEWVWKALKRIPLSPKGEYYLTDLVGLAAAEMGEIKSLELENTEETLGINTRVHLAEAEEAMRWRINERWMLAGVSLFNPQETYIEDTVTIGQDTTILPNTYLKGKTVIGTGCTLGPNCIITDSEIGKDCTVVMAVMDGARIEDKVSIGPFARLRKGAHLATGVHMGNFGEVKNSYLGPETKMGHFSYIGDAQIGENVNIGAGTVTCNFDGKNKNVTEIGDNVFIGSDTMLVAPLKLGKSARTGAGSVVTHDVPDETVVVGVPARALRKVRKEEK